MEFLNNYSFRDDSFTLTEGDRGWILKGGIVLIFYNRSVVLLEDKASYAFLFEIKVQEVAIANRLISPSSYVVWKQQFCPITR